MTSDEHLTVTDTLTTEGLAAALRAQARGAYAAEAAVELLIRHGDPWGHGWLDRPEFRACIDVGPSFTTPKVLMASIDWDRATGLTGSSSAIDILNIARVLAGEDLTEPFSVAGLDDTNRELVLRAVLHAAQGSTANPITVCPFERD